MFTVYDATTNMHKVYNVKEIDTNYLRNLNIFQKLNPLQEEKYQLNSNQFRRTKKENAQRQSKYNPSLLTHVNIKMCHFLKFIIKATELFMFWTHSKGMLRRWRPSPFLCL